MKIYVQPPDSNTNVDTILHISGDAEILRIKIALSGKAWGKKMDAKRLFKNAPFGSKLVIKNMDLAGLEFPPGEKTSLWVSSTEFDWSVHKSDNQEEGSISTNDLSVLGITDWVLRAHILPVQDSTQATIRWVAIPTPLADLSRNS